MWVKNHPELESAPAFGFTILAQYKDCLSRQVGEAIKILYSPDYLLNSKSEYLNNCLTRITINEQDWEKRERERLEAEDERLEIARIEAFRLEKMKAKAIRSTIPVEDEVMITQADLVREEEDVINISSQHQKVPACLSLTGWWRRMKVKLKDQP